MVKQVAQRGAQFSLLYGGRRKSTMAFLDQFSEFGERVRVVPENREGPLDLAAAMSQFTPETKVYCCGPEGLISAVEQLCAQRDPDALHVERFAARESGAHRPVDPRPLIVALARSEMELPVPADRSILDVISEAGVDVPYDCMEGICGSCEVNVLEGDIEHADQVLTKQEKASNTVMMICCSRARSPRIVLDI
jgi:ferredoxin